MANTFKRGRVELMISCRDLVSLDVFTKTDPMCVLFIKQFGQWKEFGRTEAIAESLNPGFTDSFIADFEPGIFQSLLFSVYYIDSRSSDLRKHDFVGSVELTLESLVDLSKPWTTTTTTLRRAGDPKPRGLMNITAEIVKETKGKAQFHIAGHKLGKIGLFAKKPDAYLEIGRQINSVTYQPVFRTEVQYKTREPWWRPLEISVQKLCNDQWERSIQFSCWHSGSGGSAGNSTTLLGVTTVTLKELTNMKSVNNFKRLDLVDPKKERKNKKKKFSGSLRFYQCRVEMQHSLMDYIQGGCQLRLIIAIDFTSSNGPISDEMSLHSSEVENNQYLTTIETLGALIARYDIEQKIALFGFGARRKEGDNPKMCFPIHDKITNTWVSGVKGVVEAYNNILPQLQFSGPTFIAPVISTVTKLIQHEKVTQEEQSYYVLLILTDGVINDIDSTVQQLISTSSLPLSVIITGIGPADFTLMDQFHVNVNSPLTDERTKKSAERPNVHFVAFNKDHMRSAGSSTTVIQETFAALSIHLTRYMKSKNIVPNQARLMRMDPIKGWVNPNMSLTNEDDQFGEIRLYPLRSSSSMISVSNSMSGPMCPTCGSHLEQGQNLSNGCVSVL